VMVAVNAARSGAAGPSHTRARARAHARLRGRTTAADVDPALYFSCSVVASGGGRAQVSTRCAIRSGDLTRFEPGTAHERAFVWSGLAAWSVRV
jgi:hypothetical protein